MSGSEDELPDDSSRLRDRARNGLERAREGSTRLRDRTQSAFERRRQQAQQAREAVAAQRDRFADTLDLSDDMIEPVQLDDRGEEIGFVPDEGGRDALADRFAAGRPFVEPADAAVDADPREGVRTATDPDRRDEIGARAREDAAGDSDLIRPGDLDAEVGAGGVESIETAPDRRDDIADRARSEFAAGDPFAEPGDFGVDVGPRGIEDAGLTETGERRRAGRQFEAETPLDSVDTQRDIEPAGDGFGLTTRADRRVAAREFESDLSQFGRGELDPQTDVRQTGDGFGLARDPAREVAADRIDDDISEIDVGPSDIELEETAGGGFEATFEREVER